MYMQKATSSRAVDRSEQEQQPLTLSVPEAASLLGIGTTLCWQLVNTRQLPSIRLGRRVLVPRAAIEQMARAVAEDVST